jgi:hypothetical protein
VGLKDYYPIGDVRRYLMYCRSYGDRHRATMHFYEIPDMIRREMARLDYSLAEQECPQKISIGKLRREAVDEMTIRDSKAT